MLKNLSVEQAYVFFQLGRESALKLEIGKPFIGAFGAACVHGLSNGTLEFKLFVSGFMFGLEESGHSDRVVCNEQGLIVSFR